MAFTFRTATSGTGTGTSIVVTAPTGLTNADVMDIWIGYGDEPFDTTITPPAGWTSRFATDDGADLGFKFVCYTRVASGEGASWTFTLSASQAYTWGCMASAGGTGSLTGTASGVARIGGSSAYTSPSITPAVDGAVIRAGYFTDTDTSRTATPDSSPTATEEIEQAGNNGQALYVQRYVQSTAGAQALDMTWSGAAVGQYTLTGIIAWAPSATTSFHPNLPLLGVG